MRVRDAVLSVAAALIVALPGFAAAQDAVLYEASETMRISGGKMVRRVAQAALIGWVNPGNVLCPGTTRCSINVQASDDLDLTTGLGPVTGKFAIVTQDQNLVDAPEQIVTRGWLMGNVDLSPAILHATPIGTIVGTWTGKAKDGQPAPTGNFTGTFRMPFSYNDMPSYLIPPTTIVPVAQNEMAGGWPMVKLELYFQ